MQIHHVGPDRFTRLDALPEALPTQGFLWIGVTRNQFESHHAALQDSLQRWEGGPLVDLHVSDLLNEQLPSEFDYTSWYDLLVFRRLATGVNGIAQAAAAGRALTPSARRTLESVDTSPVGFAVFDHVLLTVHPEDCAVLAHFAQRLTGLAGSKDIRGSGRSDAAHGQLHGR